MNSILAKRWFWPPDPNTSVEIVDPPELDTGVERRFGADPERRSDRFAVLLRSHARPPVRVHRRAMPASEKPAQKRKYGEQSQFDRSGQLNRPVTHQNGKTAAPKSRRLPIGCWQMTADQADRLRLM